MLYDEPSFPLTSGRESPALWPLVKESEGSKVKIDAGESSLALTTIEVTAKCFMKMHGK